VIIPADNEAERLPHTLRRVQDKHTHFRFFDYLGIFRDTLKVRSNLLCGKYDLSHFSLTQALD
jgi:hypothetical protein